MKTLYQIAIGKHIYSTYFLLICMLVFPAAMFTTWRWLDLCAWGLLIILGGFINLTGWVTLEEGKRSKSWPRVEAQGVKTKIRSSISGNNSKVYRLEIECLFEVNGEVYTGTRYDLSDSSASRSRAEKRQKEVESQDPFMLRYDPLDPNNNVVKPGVRLVHYLRIVFGVAMMVIPVMIETGYLTLQ